MKSAPGTTSGVPVETHDSNLECRKSWVMASSARVSTIEHVRACMWQLHPQSSSPHHRRQSNVACTRLVGIISYMAVALREPSVSRIRTRQLCWYTVDASLQQSGCSGI